MQFVETKDPPMIKIILQQCISVPLSQINYKLREKDREKGERRKREVKGGK